MAYKIIAKPNSGVLCKIGILQSYEIKHTGKLLLGHSENFCNLGKRYLPCKKQSQNSKEFLFLFVAL